MPRADGDIAAVPGAVDLVLVFGTPDNVAHVLDRHRELGREAGQPAKLRVRPRRRHRAGGPDGRPTSATGWKPAGGGGSRGGGGGRAAVDEKKMVRGRPGRRGCRRAFRGRRAA